MNIKQLDAVAQILKREFPDVTISKLIGLSYEIIETVLNQCEKSQFPGWFLNERLREDK